MSKRRLWVGARIVALFGFVLAGCGTEEPAPTDAPAASAPTVDPAATAPPRSEAREVIAESLPYAEVGDELVYGHFAIPVDMIDPLPAVVLVHDWYGLDENMRSTAEQLAAEGYIVLAVDLFLGKSTESVTAARQLEIDVIENPKRAEENLEQAISFIRVSSGAPSIAIVGYGFGGGWAVRTAVNSPSSLSAAVSFYGQVINDEDALADANVPLLGIYLESDRAVTAKSAREFQEKLVALEKDTEFYFYDGVRRGFMDPGSDTYDRETAEQAWARMRTFLNARLDSD